MIVLDTTVPVHFARAGALNEFEAFLGGRHVVPYVVRTEILAKAEKFSLPELAEFVRRMEARGAVHALSEEEARDVEDLVGPLEVRQRFASWKHEDADLGEAEAVILSLRFGGEVILLDDRGGVDWAEEYHCRYQKTFEVAVQMRQAGLITEQVCRKIHKLTRDDKYWPKFLQEFQLSSDRFVGST